MDYQQIAVAFHLLGFALGLGGATISDITFFKIIRNKSLSTEQYNFLKSLSFVIWIGLWILIVSGLVIFWLIYSEQGSLPMLRSPRWQTKLTLVFVVLLNGFYFRSAIFPMLKNLVGKSLNMGNISPIIWKLALSGTISILSWYTIFIVTLLPRTFRPHYLYFMGVYLVMLFIGVILSKKIIGSYINS